MARPHQGAEDREVLDADDVQRALTRIAHEVLERNKGASRSFSRHPHAWCAPGAATGTTHQ